MTHKQALLQPISLKDLELPNRIIMAPMTRSRADNSEKKVTLDLQGEYYVQRASAGLIITEGSQVSKEGVGYINTPGIHSEVQTDAWKKVVSAVHDAGGRIFIQLWHVGRISHPDFHSGELPLAPSAINPNGKAYTPDGFKDTVTPKAMTQEDIERTIDDFASAGKNAIAAGFDGVEIHASNGYLFHQFFNNSSNQRTDQYGGSIENKTRFLFEVLDRIKQYVPENRIGIRLNPSLHGMSGIEVDEETIPTFEYIVRRLNDFDLSYLHLSEPFSDVSDVPHAVEKIAQHFRPLYQGNLMINAGFDKEKGNRYIDNGCADLVAYGKPFISNPDLVSRFAHGYPLSDWDKDTFYTPGKKGYTDYPFYKQ